MFLPYLSIENVVFMNYNMVKSNNGNGKMINDPFKINEKTVNNRVVFQPMEGCDCETDGSPSVLTSAKYMKNALSHAGILWFEANAVTPEGRTNPRQMMLTSENVSRFKRLIEDVDAAAEKECGFKPLKIIQLTHSGRQSITPITAYRNAVYEAARPCGDENIATDEYLDSLPQKFAESAKLALTAGFDGVDVKCCHGYLMQELLSAYTRPGKYGGSYENRTRLLLSCIKAVKQSVPEDFIITTRLSVVDMVPYPNGFGTDADGKMDLSEPLSLIGDIKSAGVMMLNVTLGNPYYNPHVNRPYRMGAYIAPEKPEEGLKRFEQVEKAIKAEYPDLPVVGSGLSYYRADIMEQAERQLMEGICDFVGFGRQTLAYPEFYKDWIRGSFNAKNCCVACSKCTSLMRGKCVSGCAVFNDYYKDLYNKNIKK